MGQIYWVILEFTEQVGQGRGQIQTLPFKQLRILA
jgi:hypothetical protein